MKKAMLIPVLALVSAINAQAAELSLPLNMALEAAQAAVASCEKKGYHVTAAVVNFHGETQVLLKGDRSTVHTKDTAFRKAYTLVTLGPIFDLNASSEALKMLSGKPSEAPFLTIPNIAPLPGAVAIKSGGEIIAALGVGGAPGGEKDEQCAADGVSAIQGRLAK